MPASESIRHNASIIGKTFSIYGREFLPHLTIHKKYQNTLTEQSLYNRIVGDMLA